MAQPREGFRTWGWGCRQPLCHGSARSRIQDAGPGEQAASLSQLSMEQGLRHKAGSMEQLGVATTAFWLLLGGPHLVPKLSGLYQAAEHPSPEPSLWLPWDAGTRLPGGSGMPVVRSIPCRAPGRELPPLLSHHSVFYFACRSRRWPSDVSASRPFSWLLEMVDGLSL